MREGLQVQPATRTGDNPAYGVEPKDGEAWRVASERAARALSQYLRETPVLRSRSLDREFEQNLFFKAENLQVSGSYKPRGAFGSMLALRDLPVEVPTGGVIADSSGNYGQALALAGLRLGIPVTVVLPETCNPLKVSACRDYGAEAIIDGVTWSNRTEVAQNIARERDLLPLPADAWSGMIGDSTMALEVLRQVPEAEVLLVPLSSGGLLASIAALVKHLRPNVRVVGVQPETSGHARMSLAAGEIHRLAEAPITLADGARTLALTDRTFSILERTLDDVVHVSEENILHSMWWIMTRLKTVVEPTGALAFGAVVAGHVETGKNVVCVMSGGNVDLREVGSHFAGMSRPKSRQQTVTTCSVTSDGKNPGRDVQVGTLYERKWRR